MFSLIALYVSYRRERAAERAVVRATASPVRLGANDSGPELARAA